MRRVFQRTVCLFLVLLTVFSLLPVMPVQTEAACSHSWGNAGKCSTCGTIFNFLPTRTVETGTIQISDKLWPMKTPYSAGAGGTNLIDNAGNKITVSGSVRYVAWVTNAYGKKWYEIRLEDGRTGYIYPEGQKVNTAEVYSTNVEIVLNNKYANYNVYVEPYSDSTKLTGTMIPAGTHGIATGVVKNAHGNCWYKVEINGITGWISADHCSIAGVAPGAVTVSDFTSFIKCKKDTDKVDLKEDLKATNCTITKITGALRSGETVKQSSYVTGSFTTFDVKTGKTNQSSSGSNGTINLALTPRKLEVGLYVYTLDVSVKVKIAEGNTIKDKTYDNIRVLSDTFEVYSGSSSALTITLNANGGSCARKDLMVYSGKSVGTLPEPEQVGKRFLGWYTAKTGGTQVTQNFTFTSNTTIYAHWGSDSFNVTYDANGGTGAPGVQTKARGQSMTLSKAEPTRAYYVFKGWAKSKSATKPDYAKGGTYTYTADADMILYAVWEKLTVYDMKYHANGTGVTNMPGNDQKIKDQKYTVSSVVPKRTGYVFKNWNTSADPAWNDPSIKSGADYLVNQAANFYAQWEPIEYEIKYDPNGGKGFLGFVDMLNSELTYGETYTLKKNQYSRDGYEFSGWNTKADGSGKSYKDEESVKNLSSTDGATVTLYAQWKKKNEEPKATQPAPKETTPKETPPKATEPPKNPIPDKTLPNQTIRIPTDAEIPANQKKPEDYPVAKTYADVEAIVMDYWNTVTSNGQKRAYWNNHIREANAIKTEPILNTITRTPCQSSGNADIHYHYGGDCPGSMTNKTGCTNYCTSNYFCWEKSPGVYSCEAQCEGFSYYMAWVVFRKMFNDPTAYMKIDGANLPSDYEIKPGDILRAKWNWTEQSASHSMFVYKVENGKAYFIECNYSNDGRDTNGCRIFIDRCNDTTPKDTQAMVDILKKTPGGYVISSKAVPSVKTYNIHFDANKPSGAKNPTGTMADQKAYLGASTTLVANAFKIEGYVFDGWNTKKDGKGTAIKDKGSVTDLTTTENATVTLYAQWRSKAADDYLKSCTSFTSSLRAKVTVASNTENMKSLPCSEGTNSASKTIRFLQKDEKLTVTGLLKNPQGNYWYKVKADSDGAEGYVFGKQLEVWSENNVAFKVALEKYQIPQGDKKGCEISGSVSSAQYGIASLTGVLDDSDPSTAAQTRTITNGFSTIQNTTVDNDLAFSELKRGKGTLTLTATMKNNYRYDEGKNTHVQASETKIIDFTVVGQYNVKFNKNTTDAVSNMPETQGKTDGKAINLSSKVPARTNYAFLGWAKDEKATEADFKAGAELKEDTAAGDLILYAVWKRVDAYDIIYKPNADDVTNMPDNDHKIKGETYTISNKIPTRVGYLFDNWNTSKDPFMNLFVYTPGETYKNDENLTLYAQWEEGYAVYYDKNGGTGNMEPSSFERGKKVNLAKNSFTRDKYVFLRWNTKADGSGDSYSDSAEVKNLADKGGSIKLYAQWTNTYQVQYHYNVSLLKQGQIFGDMKPSFFEMDKDYNLPPNPYTRVDENLIAKDVTYVFLGWNTKADGTGTFYEDQAKVRNLASQPGKTVNLYAQWAEQDEVFTVVYNKNGGTGTMQDSVIALDTSAPLRKNTFTRTGYTFEKWTTGSGGTGSSYTDGASVRNLTRGGGTITLYAQWKSNAKVYTVQYVANGGTGTMQNSSHTVGVASNLNPNGFTRPGYVFEGWSTKADGSDKQYGEKASVLNLATTDKAVVKLYAQWQEETEAEYLKSCTLYPSYMNLTVTNGSGKIMALPVAGGTAVRQLIAGEQMVSTGLYKNSKGEYWYQVRANRDSKVGYVFAGDVSSKGIADRTVDFGVWLNKNSILRGYACDILGSVSARYNILYKVTGVLDDSDPKTEAQTQTITTGFEDVKGTNLNKKLAFAPLSRGKGTLKLTAMLRSAYSTDGKTLLWEKYTTGEYPLDFRIIGIYNVFFDENTTDDVANMPNTQNKTDETDLPLPANVPTRTGYTFQGWAKKKDAKEPDYLASEYLREDTDTGNLTLYAVWDGPNEYTITFDANGGTGGPETATATHWKEFYYPQNNPTLAGCTFLGWSKTQDVDGNAADAEDYLLKQPVQFTEDTTLYAVWKHETVTITYYHNDGSGQTTVESILASKVHTLPGTDWITRDGYVLLGYAETAGATEPAYLPGGEITIGANKILHLVWKPEIWMVTYHANGGSGAPEAQEKRKNVDLVLSSQIPVRMNDEFLGWSDSPGSKDVLYHPGDTYTANADITLYAVWEATMGASTFTVTYDANGGVGAPAPQTKYEGVDLLVSQQWPTREGYYCMGWATTPNAVMPNVGGLYTEDRDVTFYAVWQEDSSEDLTYTVTFDPNGGYHEPVPQTKIHGVDLLLSDIEPRREGKQFIGWAHDPNADMPSVSNYYRVDENVTLYAVWWDLGGYNLYYEVNGGQGGEDWDFIELNNPYILTTDVPTREGFLFAGWSENQEAETAHYFPNDVFTEKRDLTLYAVWEENVNDLKTYDVIFDLNNGMLGPRRAVKIQGRDMALPVYIPERPHHQFLGWAKRSDATLPDFPVTGDWTYKEDAAITLYAIWERITFTVSYESTGESGCPETQIKYSGEPLTISPEIPTREGFVFLGWGKNPEGYGVDYLPGDSFDLDENLTLYAIWQEN